MAMAQLTPNYIKIVEALLYLMELAGERPLDQYKLGKALFFADREHLNLFGRPITFCNYAAMKDGPVPSEAYSLLKGEPLKGGQHIDTPWQAKNVRDNIFNYIPERVANRRKLSVSDLETLEAAYEFVKDKSFGEIRNLTHEDHAYAEAWDRRGEKNSVRMKLELLANGDADLADDLVFASHHAVK